MDWASLRLSAGTSYIGPPAKVGRHVFTNPDFHSTWIILSGWAEVRSGTRQWRAQVGDTLVAPPQWRRYQAFAEGAVIISLGLSLRWSDGRFLLAQEAPVIFRDPPLADLARAAIDQAPQAGAAWLAARGALHAYAARWLLDVQAAGVRYQPSASDDLRVDRACRVLGEHPGLGALPYAALRQATGLSRNQLDRRFREVLGLTPRQVRDRAALVRARELLADPARKLAAIAIELGATDASHLVKWFRRQTGRTPGEERRLGPGA